MAVLLDSDILIDYLRGRPEAIAYLEGLTVPLRISAMTIAELYAGVREGRERPILAKFLEAFDSIPVDEEIAQRGGLFRRDFGPSHNTGLADAVIAATAEREGIPLVTLNARHYPMLKAVEVPYRKT